MKDILGKYCSLTLSFRRIILIAVETVTMIRKSTIPTIGPVATKTTERAAGRQIPNPRMPMTFLENAITKATMGRRRRSTSVLAGTPEATLDLIAYLTGLNGQTFPNF